MVFVLQQPALAGELALVGDVLRDLQRAHVGALLVADGEVADVHEAGPRLVQLDPELGHVLPAGPEVADDLVDHVDAARRVAVLDLAADDRLGADEDAVRAACDAGFGSLGPIGLDMEVVVDRSAAHLADFVCGANKDDVHYTGANWGRDTGPIRIEDIRNVVEGDPSPDGKGHIQIKRGIEVGHIFQLGTKYSEAMNARVLDENGKNITMTMGCYGIGVTRIVAAAIEQNHDEQGILWPDSMAPFQLAIVPLNMQKSPEVAQCAESLYQACLDHGIEVLLDDRNERPGVKFADMELVGIPHRVVIGDRALKEGNLEYKGRTDTDSQLVPQGDIVDFLTGKLG